MQWKKMLACLTAGLPVPFGAKAENYHWDNFALKGIGSDAFAVRSATGSNFSGAYDASYQRFGAIAIGAEGSANARAPAIALILGVGALALAAARRRPAALVAAWRRPAR